MHVFVEAGLKFLKKKSAYNIFEMGFGTGLNALVALDYSLKNKQTIKYSGIEKYPLSLEMVKDLDYTAIENLKHINLFEQLHNIDWNVMTEITPQYSLNKIPLNWLTVPCHIGLLCN